MGKYLRFAALGLTALLLSGCGRFDGTYYYNHAVYADFDPASLAGEQPSPITLNVGAATTQAPVTEAPVPGGDLPDAAPRFLPMTVLEETPVYVSANAGSRQIGTLFAGDAVEMSEAENGYLCVRVDGSILGYCEKGSAVSGEYKMYGELPVEYGLARNEKYEFVPASSHLVDITRYTDKVIVAMQLSTEDTSIGEPFYNRNLCMIQYDTVQKLLKAVELFEADGYYIKIYDAYRPTSVQQRWFDVIGVHKWVADPSIGMGGRHDRGCAIDMSLVDANGNELEFPTPMHTLTEAASRYAYMTDAAKKNVEYMTQIMVKCGFDYINSDWWHFQDTEIESYLPTDHPIDEIPLVAGEA